MASTILFGIAIMFSSPSQRAKETLCEFQLIDLLYSWIERHAAQAPPQRQALARAIPPIRNPNSKIQNYRPAPTTHKHCARSTPAHTPGGVRSSTQIPR